MPSTSHRWSESWRVLAYSAALGLGFIALERIELALFSAFGTRDVLARIGAGTARDDERLAVEAAQIASRSAAPSAPGHRRATFRLGYEIGFASELLGAFARSDAPARAKVEVMAAAHNAVASAAARTLGLGDASALPMRNGADFLALSQRLESDENGLGARVEARLTPIHRHLYLLGAHIGAHAVQLETSGGKLALAPASLVRRHATLAGIAPALWRPFAADAGRASPAEVLERHRAALGALDADLAARDANDARSFTTPLPVTPR